MNLASPGWDGGSRGLGVAAGLGGAGPGAGASPPRAVNTVCSCLGLIYICVNSLWGACAQLGHCTEEAACFVHTNISIYFCTWGLLLHPCCSLSLPFLELVSSGGAVGGCSPYRLMPGRRREGMGFP